MGKKVSVSLRVDKDKLKRIQRIAREEAYKKDEKIQYTDLIRKGIDMVIEEKS